MKHALLERPARDHDPADLSAQADRVADTLDSPFTRGTRVSAAT